MLQVNGKMRGSVEVDKEISQDGALEAARSVPSISKQLEGKEVMKIIFVPGKIINIIVGK